MGTPGRLVDLIKRKAIKLDQLETLILDEADEMLNMGFLEDIHFIIEKHQKLVKHCFSQQQCQMTSKKLV